MIPIESQIQQIEQSIKESRKFVELGEALTRLRSNRDFKKIILEGFFEQEAIRLVHLKSDINMQSAEAQKSILSQMDAIGSLAQYLHLVEHKAAMARKGIAFDEEVRDELLQESLNDR